MKLKKYFLLNGKKLLIIIGAEVVSILLHNVVSGLFGFEEALFFIIAIFVIPIYLLISVPLTLLNNILGKKRKK